MKPALLLLCLTSSLLRRFYGAGSDFRSTDEVDQVRLAQEPTNGWCFI